VPVEFRVIHSRDDTKADLTRGTLLAEVRFAAAVRKAQFDATNGFAAPTEKTERELLSARTDHGLSRLFRGLTARWAEACRFARAFIPQKSRVMGVASLLRRTLS
jgi:hypothetical protein